MSYLSSSAVTGLVSATGGGSESLTGLSGWVADVMTRLGGPGVGAVVALENLFPPIPSEVVLPLGGFLAGEGRINVVSVILWATLGSVVGALILYALGAWLGLVRLRRLAGRMPLVSVSDVDQAVRWFDRHGGQAVLFGRMVPLVRSFVSIPAGVTRMPLARFTLYTALGSGLWNTIFVVLGYVLGQRWQSVGQYSSWINNAVVLVIVAAVGWVFVQRWRERRAASS